MKTTCIRSFAVAAGVAVLSAGAASASGIVTNIGDWAAKDIRVVNSTARLGRLPDGIPPRDEPVNYGLISFLQLSGDRALAMVNRNVWPKNANWDWEDGSDLFVVGSLDELKTAKGIPHGRSGVFPDPARNGEKRWHNRYPSVGGFVPFGAKLNGKPHPHAGTGFLLNVTLTYPVAADGTFQQRGDAAGFAKGDVLQELEFSSLAYDGKEFTVRPGTRHLKETPLKLGETGWVLFAAGLANAIPDGEDLLFPVKAQYGTAERFASGVSRWKRLNGNWQPVDFTPVTEKVGNVNPYEPSLVRDAKGAFIFAARDEGGPDRKHPNRLDAYQDLKAWRSADNGKTWTQILFLSRVRSWSPLSVGTTADGRAFIAANPIDAIGGGWIDRTLLALWPFNGDYTKLGQRIVIRDAKKLKAAKRQLLADHPYFSRLRFKDGNWHSVVSYRVRLQHQRENGKPLDPGPDDGAYAEEIVSEGQSLPVWEF